MRGVDHEVSALEVGMDFRRPEYRREVFLRFYEFHLRHRSHPGCVYFLLPALARAGGWGVEGKLWFAFLNGNTQNPVASLLVHREFPSAHALDPARFRAWWERHRAIVDFDTDRRYFRTKLPESVDCYRALLRGRSQAEYFRRLVEPAGDPRANFRSLWGEVSRRYKFFGRLSVFSYLEYLRIFGMPVECDQLFLTDLDGSRSHRNGLAIVLGRDDLDWHDSNPGFDGRYSPALFEWLAAEADELLHEARTRFRGREFERDVGYFTLESALCTYKSWHRPNRRYPNVYADMLVGRIRSAERKWGDLLERAPRAAPRGAPAGGPAGRRRGRLAEAELVPGDR